MGSLTPTLKMSGFPLTNKMNKPFKPFQIRWKEAMGDEKDPYLYRWTFLFFNYSIRIHHWIRSDDSRFFHDHACNFISFVIKGDYYNVMPEGRVHVKAGQVWRSNALTRHYLEVPEKGAWTLLFCGRPYHQWGFYVGDRKFRPLRYFHTYYGSAVNKPAETA